MHRNGDSQASTFLVAPRHAVLAQTGSLSALIIITLHNAGPYAGDVSCTITQGHFKRGIRSLHVWISNDTHLNMAIANVLMGHDRR